MIFLNDPLLWMAVLGLISTSLFLILSTAQSLLFAQGFFFGVGFLLFFLIQKIPFYLIRRFSWVLYIGSFLFLGVVFLNPHVRGAHRWIEILGWQMQPSELLKPLVIILFSHFAAESPPISLRPFLRLFVLFLPICLLIFRQPDLGNVLVYVTFFISILIISGLPWKYFLIGSLSFVLLLPIFWHTLHDYQKDRIVSFVNPYSDPAGAGYNALQAMIAVGSGQWYGLGLGRGTQSRLAFLPEYHTDFVFASLGEELGLLGGFLIIVFYGVLFLRILGRAFHSVDEFEKYVIVGIFSQLFIQVFINIGMNIGLLPIT